MARYRRIRTNHNAPTLAHRQAGYEFDGHTMPEYPFVVFETCGDKARPHDVDCVEEIKDDD